MRLNEILVRWVIEAERKQLSCDAQSKMNGCHDGLNLDL
jgi:hypothetical protein